MMHRRMKFSYCHVSNHFYLTSKYRTSLFWFQKLHFLTFLHVSKSQYFFSNLNYNCSNLVDMRNLQEQVKKAFCYQKLFWPFTVWINCSSDFKSFENSRPSSSNFRSFSQCLEQFFLKVGQNNIGNKIPILKRNYEEGRIGFKKDLEFSQENKYLITFLMKSDKIM